MKMYRNERDNTDIMIQTEATIGKKPLWLIGAVLLVTMGVNVWLGVSAAQRETNEAKRHEELMLEVRALKMSASPRTDTERGFFPLEKPKRGNE